VGRRLPQGKGLIHIQCITLGPEKEKSQ